MSHFSQKITSQLLALDVIQEEDFEIYNFGIHEGLFVLCNGLTAALIVIFTKQVWQVALYVTVYMQLRKFSGGYHAQTHVRCYILSTITLLLSLYSYPMLEQNIWLMLLFYVLAIIILYLMSPMSNPNKPLDNAEKAVYAKKIHARMVVCSLLVVLCCYLKQSEVIAIITTASTMVSALLLVEWVKQK